jgi:GNAT superfamily N-acetyltransferase
MGQSRTSTTEITTLVSSDTGTAARLWSDYVQHIGGNQPELVATWRDNDAVRAFIAGHADAGTGVVARSNGTMVAFMTYDRFEFHSDDSAFVPIIGHARRPSISPRIYQAMYRTIAQPLTENGCGNHLLTYLSNDTELQATLFQLGFGLFVVDAFRPSAESISNVPSLKNVEIREATVDDAEQIHELVIRFERHYRGSPLFLCREPETVDEIRYYIGPESRAVFVAEDDGRVIGFINVQIAQESRPTSLVDRGTGIIEPLGAYVLPEYRGRGTAAVLLERACRWYSDRNVSQVHVDFESANIEGSAFWTRHFSPTLHSVKRTVNRDAVGSTEGQR